MTNGQWLYLLAMVLAEAEDLNDAAGKERSGATKRYVSTRRKNKTNIPKRPQP